MRSIRSELLGAALLTLTAVAVADDNLHETFDQGNQAFAQALLNGDVESAVAAYTDSACVIAPMAENACGTEQIRAFWTGVVESAPQDVKLTTGEVGASGELAYVTGTLELTDAGGAVHDFRYVLVFKMVDGAWKLHLDTWTPSP